MQQFPLETGDESGIFFTSEDVDFVLIDEQRTSLWLQKVIEQEEKSLRLLNFIFCSDEFLHRLNVAYLSHDTFTDIITFPYEEPPLVAGDVFISIDRVRDNAGQFQTAFEQELNRVMAHGVFHLCGYGDKTEDEEKRMRQKENEALALWERGA
ncbi:MAG: rRNA maturation RNase YbeY [Saprospiraceae bacterium]